MLHLQPEQRCSTFPLNGSGGFVATVTVARFAGGRCLAMNVRSFACNLWGQSFINNERYKLGYSAMDASLATAFMKLLV